MSAASAAAPEAVLFDLDGTLIDSAPGILASFEAALRATGLEPGVPLSPSLIGPPLAQTVATLLGRDDPAAVEAMVAAYRADYDVSGYRATAVYEGVPEMLDTLAQSGIALHIVTNKRIAPTRLILDHLGWTPRFAGIYALDALQPPAPHKPALVGEVLRRERIAAERAWMVGDSAEDRRAAETHALRFFGAGWGYGAGYGPTASGQGLRRPAELLAALPHAS